MDAEQRPQAPSTQLEEAHLTATTLGCAGRYLSRAQHQMLVLLLPLPNRLVQGYHKRYIAFVRFFQQKQFGDVVVLDLVVIPTEEEDGVMETSTPFPKAQNRVNKKCGIRQYHERNKRGSKESEVTLEETKRHDRGKTNKAWQQYREHVSKDAVKTEKWPHLEPCIRMKWLYISIE